MCGIKNSACANQPDPIDDVNKLYRFAFVDRNNGLWSLGPIKVYEQFPTIECPIGGHVVFHYPGSQHDIVFMASENHYEKCDFNGAIEQAPLVQNSSFPSQTYFYECKYPNRTEYVSCSVPGHCESGQKIKIHTSDTVYAFVNDTDDSQDQNEQIEWSIHVSSLTRVMRLLGSRTDPITGFLIMDRGYQTEEVAEQTLEWIWCGLDHCPTFADIWNKNEVITKEDCEGAVYTLMGFVSRKRPVPRWNASEAYYRKAIDKGGRNECAARSYLTKMFLDVGDNSSAFHEAEEMCLICGKGFASDVYGDAVRQTRAEFDALDSSLWPTISGCSHLGSMTDKNNNSSFHSNSVGNFPFFLVMMFIFLRV